MSAQAYTNKRRVLAEASALKVQYIKNVAFTNSLISTINCNQTFQTLAYKDICACPFNGRGTLRPTPSPITPSINGGNSETGVGNVSLWFDGGNSGSLGEIYLLDGGNA
jgi:hypothetical protein